MSAVPLYHKKKKEMNYMKETVLITGANSFIARHLTPLLQDRYKVKLLTRTPKSEHEYAWNLDQWEMDERALEGVNHIIHLSGSKLNDGTPLSTERKKLIYDTRIGAADFLRKQLKAHSQSLKTFISASAIGYYGFTDRSLEIDEQGEKGVGFNADLCADWESAADRFKEEQVAEHVAKIRVSLVLGPDGGIFPVYKNMVEANPGIALQSNPGAYPWNHVADMAGIFAFALTHQLDGVYNSVAPQPASLQGIFQAIANHTSKMHKEIPAFQGQHLIAHKIINAGYQFKYPNIEQAIDQLLA